MTDDTKPKLNPWQKEFALKDPLLQEDMERFDEALFALSQNSRFRQRVSNMHRNVALRALDASTVGDGMALRAAIEADWIVSPECKVGELGKDKVWFYGDKDVSKLNPGVVGWLGPQIDLAYEKAKTVPKNL